MKQASEQQAINCIRELLATWKAPVPFFRVRSQLKYDTGIIWASRTAFEQWLWDQGFTTRWAPVPQPLNRALKSVLVVSDA